MKLFCYMVTGVSLSDIQRDVLYETAKGMMHDGQRKRRFKHDDIEGLTWTKYESCCLAGTSGIHFMAEFDCEDGSCKASFMIRSSDFTDEEKAKWVRVTPRRQRKKTDPSDN